MKKSLLVASLCCALAAAANAQPSTTQPPGADAQPSTTQPPAVQPATPPADTRAADMDRMMDIRNWQTGQSAGDAAAKIDPKATPAAAPDEKRAADLQTMMEIRSWQTGPSSGDAAAKAETQPSTQAAPPVNLNSTGAQQELHDASTP